MKFKDIKVGDKVLVWVYASFNKMFYIPKEVDKVTPKQFRVDGSLYRKSNGDQVGDRFSTAEYVSPELDQTGDYNKFLSRKKLARRLVDITWLHVEKLTLNQLERIDSILNE